MIQYPPKKRYTAFLPLAWCLLLAPPALGANSSQTQCQSIVYRNIGEFFHCQMKAESALVKGKDPAKFERIQEKCAERFQKAVDEALRHAGGDCLAYDDGLQSATQSLSEQAPESAAAVPPSPLDRQLLTTMNAVRALVSAGTLAPVPGQLTFYNNCDKPIKIMSPTNGSIDGTTVAATGGTQSYATGSTGILAQNAANTFMLAPVTTDAQCASAQCTNWTDIQVKTQREGYMWMNNSGATPPPSTNNNLVYAAYCQPTNAAAVQCTGNSSTPCCGSNMNYDKTFGTTFEITPNGGTGLNQDFVDLSTNYGSGPTSPPTLCPPNHPGPHCVTLNANIFFNVPVSVTMNNSTACSFPMGGTELDCTAVSCTDAYQTPTDNKQVACPSGSTGYVVTFCPGSSQLPTL